MFRPGLSAKCTKMLGANPQTLCNLPIDKSFGLCYNKYTKKKGEVNKMIVITKQITREVLIQEDTFQEYCERSGYDPQEILDEVRSGERNLDHLSYLTLEDETFCEIRKIN